MKRLTDKVKHVLKLSRFFIFYYCLNLRFQAKNAMCIAASRADFSAHSTACCWGRGGGREGGRTGDRMASDPCSHMVGVGGQYKMYTGA
jgi:hypothetical protein